MRHKLRTGLISYIAIVGGLWGVVEVYTYFEGDQLRNFLGNYWIIFFLIIPAAVAFVIGYRSSSGIHEFGPETIALALDNVETNISRPARIEHHKLLRKFVQQKDIEDYIPGGLSSGMLFDPAIPIPSNSTFLDLIGSVITRLGKTTLILPSKYSGPDVEGVGRTNVIMNLLRITVPYGRLLGVRQEDLAAISPIPIYADKSSTFKLLASDAVYLGVSGSRLSVIPMKGEIATFYWDMARHIFRSTDLNYESGDHRLEKNRPRLMRLFHGMDISEQQLEIFGKTDELYPIDEVVIIERQIEARSVPPSKIQLNGEDYRKKLRDALLVSAGHGSPYWKREAESVKTIVDGMILNMIPLEKLPPISLIKYSHPRASIPQNIFAEIANLISGEKQSASLEVQERIEMGVGVRYHNEVLLTTLNDIDNLRLLLTSGEKLFKDISFWRSLCQRNRSIDLEILMLDPTSPEVEARQSESYRDKEAGFLQKELLENIATLKRMSACPSKEDSKINLTIGLYNEPPIFRMTFLGNHRLLVTAYDEGRRTGTNTLFYDLSVDMEGTLFQGFLNEYLRIRNGASFVN